MVMLRQKSSGNYLPLFFLGFFASFLPLSLLLPIAGPLCLKENPSSLRPGRHSFPRVTGILQRSGSSAVKTSAEAQPRETSPPSTQKVSFDPGIRSAGSDELIGGIEMNRKRRDSRGGPI